LAAISLFRSGDIKWTNPIKKSNMKWMNKIFFTGLLLGAGFLFCNQSFAADPPPNPPAGGHNLGGNQGAPGAPIDGGLGILLALGAGYAGWKLYKAHQEKKGETVHEE